MMDASLEILQAAQLGIEAPTLEEVAEIREGKRPLTPEAYTLGLLQRAILGVENMASDLRALDEKMLRKVHELHLSGAELNAIREAVAARNPHPRPLSQPHSRTPGRGETSRSSDLAIRGGPEKGQTSLGRAPGGEKAGA